MINLTSHSQDNPFCVSALLEMCFSAINEKLTKKALDIQSVFHLLSLWWTLKLIRFSFSSGKATCDGRWGAVEADWTGWWWMYCGGMIDLKKKSESRSENQSCQSVIDDCYSVSPPTGLSETRTRQMTPTGHCLAWRVLWVKYSDYMAENSNPLPLKIEFLLITCSNV